MEIRKKVFDCQEFLESIRAHNPPEPVFECFKVLRQFFKNILDNESDESKRLFKKTNAIISSKVLTVPKIEEFLKVVGFVEVDSEYLGFFGKDLGVIKAVFQNMDNYVKNYTLIPKEAKKIQVLTKKTVEDKAAAIKQIEMQFKEDREQKKLYDTSSKQSYTQPSHSP